MSPHKLLTRLTPGTNSKRSNKSTTFSCFEPLRVSAFITYLLDLLSCSRRSWTFSFRGGGPPSSPTTPVPSQSTLPTAPRASPYGPGPPEARHDIVPSGSCACRYQHPYNSLTISLPFLWVTKVVGTDIHLRQRRPCPTWSGGSPSSAVLVPQSARSPDVDPTPFSRVEATRCWRWRNSGPGRRLGYGWNEFSLIAETAFCCALQPATHYSQVPGRSSSSPGSSV